MHFAEEGTGTSPPNTALGSLEGELDRSRRGWVRVGECKGSLPRGSGSFSLLALPAVTREKKSWKQSTMRPGATQSVLL